MKSKKPMGSFAPHEVQRFILPMTLSCIVIMIGLILEGLLNSASTSPYLIIYGCLAIAYLVINNALIIRTTNFRETYGWQNAILSSIGLGLLPYVLPEYLSEVSHILIACGVVAIAIVSGRLYGYITFFGILLLGLPHILTPSGESIALLELGMPFIVSAVIMEAVLRVKDTTQQQIQRLETINQVSRQIMLSLETEETISLLDA